MTKLTAIRYLMSAAALLAISGCTTPADRAPEAIGQANLYTTKGVPVGTAKLLGYGDALVLDVSTSGLPAGPHGIHLHSIGRCAAPDFKSAGGHLNPASKAHGKDAAGGAHLGDLPNLTVNASGFARERIDISGTRIDAERAIFDGDGTAIVIHAGPDDYRTDPSGNSGARLACGEIRRS